MPRLNVPTMLSILSATLSAKPRSLFGSSSPANRGIYCSSIARATSGFSPSRSAYARPMIPCSSVNSVTMPVTRSAFDNSAARRASGSIASYAAASGASSSTIAVTSPISRSVFSYIEPSPCWKTTVFSFSRCSESDFLRSSSKKNCASARRARRTRSLPCATTSRCSLPPLRTVMNKGSRLPSAALTGK